MSENAYFKIGLFVFISLFFIVGFLAMLGSVDVFKKYIYCETYFNESVQGLENGSPVMFRGIKIGKVNRINLASNIYYQNTVLHAVNDKAYIYVQFKLNAKAIAPSISSSIKVIEKSVRNGMRISLATKGLVGSAYLEITLLKAKDNPIIEVPWKPNNLYIPSAKSRLTRFSDHVEALFIKLDNIKFAESIENFNKLTVTLNKKFSEFDSKEINQAMKVSLKSIHTSSESIFDLSQKIKLIVLDQQQNFSRMFSNISRTASSIRALMGDFKKNPSRIILGKQPPHYRGHKR
jgi:paraquat-inducible protein B